MSVLKRILGVLLIMVGFLALVTPLTPGAWLLFVGLELIGVRLVAWDRMKAWLARRWNRVRETKPSDDPNTGA